MDNSRLCFDSWIHYLKPVRVMETLIFSITRTGFLRSTWPVVSTRRLDWRSGAMTHSIWASGGKWVSLALFVVKWIFLPIAKSLILWLSALRYSLRLMHATLWVIPLYFFIPVARCPYGHLWSYRKFIQPTSRCALIRSIC